jgi:F1F0 ATPase subunit 2
MSEILSLAAAAAAGLVLGAIFFGGLWWTVARGMSSRAPALWFLGSKLLRMAIVLGGFYLTGRDHWTRWLMCLLGFVLARLIVWRLAPAPAPTPSLAPSGPEARHAP